ncbi:porin family protein [Winogradskyella arenosi]|uniref:Outer membrane protein with beta-barrel domain n=1 Tax=Winogradskyella arenosi TaxID=533325 RepID=A0A368ZMY1_9FLAO|nr:porin family protein [Winogradskyella arenosi]RCW93283.1 outer membrane protein with beta-barrel domain [Winogradskyella arenosi]
MKRHVLLLLGFIGVMGFSQNGNTDLTERYKDYREDQFYASVTYDLLNDKPSGISQNGFSAGFHFGVIRDMPINKRRNVAIGIGLGISGNSYNQKNILIQEVDNEVVFTAIDEDDYNVSKNKFETYLIEVPFEIRWRTSTATDYNFWRIYTGFKVGYLVQSIAKFKSDLGDVKISNSDRFEPLQYGLTLSAGYGTWNFHMYYGLNTIFDKESTFNGNALDTKAIKLGLMFYIL